MAVFGALNAILRADASNFRQGMNSAAQSADSFRQKTSKSFKDVNKQISELFGKKSTLGLSLKLAAGGGAIAALKMLAHEIDSFSAKLTDIQLGKAGFGELISEIPVVGGFFKTGITFFDAVSGQAARRAEQAAEIAKQTEISKAHNEAITRQMQAQVAAMKEWRDIVRDITGQRKLQGMSGMDKEAEQIRQKTAKNQEGFREKFENNDNSKELKKAAGELQAYQDLYDAAGSKINRLKKKMSGDIDPFTRQEYSSQIDDLEKKRDEIQIKMREAKEKSNYSGLYGQVKTQYGAMKDAQWREMSRGANEELQLYKNHYSGILSKLGPQLKTEGQKALGAIFQGGTAALMGDPATAANVFGKALGVKGDAKPFADGRAIHESMRTAEEKYQDELKEISGLKKMGALSEQDSARAMLRARDTFVRDSSKGSEGTFAKAPSFQSAAGQKVPKNPDVQNPLDNISKKADEQLKAALKQVDISQKQLDEAKKATKVTVTF